MDKYVYVCAHIKCSITEIKRRVLNSNIRRKKVKIINNIFILNNC